MKLDRVVSEWINFAGTDLGGSVVGLGDEVEEDLDDVAQELAGVLVPLLEVGAHREDRWTINKSD